MICLTSIRVADVNSATMAGNQPVHRSRACAVSQMDNQLSRPGDGYRSARLAIECRVEAGTDQSDRIAHGRVQPVQWQRAAMLPNRRSLYRDDQCRCTQAAGVVVTYHKRPPPRLGDLCRSARLAIECKVDAGTDLSDRIAHGRVQPVQWQRAAMLPNRRSLYRDDQCRCTQAAGVVVTHHKRPPPRLGDFCVMSKQDADG
ncbi:hypothetical protein Pla52n_44030 [Stieleria varia]|uniref:Uncharacterized protein n=1 Tax=Stieleria varia TaxID=2528005 RepID=A0A5C6APY0_9BACT|nr:hypothetical protein Pla52n_44030 [Stieleria varia]